MNSKAKSLFRSATIGFLLGAVGVDLWVAVAATILESIYFDTFSKE